jgi:ADP-heptose:LPS heptosyltransferase
MPRSAGSSEPGSEGLTRPETAPANERAIGRILVIRRKALGDALVTLPAVLRLAQAFPAAAIDLLVDRPYVALLSQLARNVRVLAWPAAGGSALSWLRALRSNRYNLVLDYLGSPRTAWWTALSGAPLRVGYDLRWRGWAYNVRVPRNRFAGFPLRAFAGEAFLDPLRALDLPVLPWHPGRTRRPEETLLSPDYRAWVMRWRQCRRPRIGLILSASWSAKAWPVAQAVRLHALLQQQGASPLWITGPGDQAIENALRLALPAADFAPPTTLLELADLLAELDLLIGTDCGVRHLAACLRVPTVTLFGPTDPHGWNPEAPRHVALSVPVPCAPCDLKECPIAGHPCLDDLAAELVATTARRLWPKLTEWRREREGDAS